MEGRAKYLNVLLVIALALILVSVNLTDSTNKLLPPKIEVLMHTDKEDFDWHSVKFWGPMAVQVLSCIAVFLGSWYTVHRSEKKLLKELKQSQKLDVTNCITDLVAEIYRSFDGANVALTNGQPITMDFLKQEIKLQIILDSTKPNELAVIKAVSIYKSSKHTTNKENWIAQITAATNKLYQQRL